jgi:TP901 family phage tail tape measure protein
MCLAKKEIYRLDIKIGVKGDAEAKKKLSATERFAKKTEKRAKALNKIKASPSVKLKDKLSKPADKVKRKMTRLNKIKANPSVKLKDKASRPIDKIKTKTDKINKVKSKPTVKLKDEVSKPLNKVESRLSKFTHSVRKKLIAIGAAGALMLGGLGISSTIKTYSDFEQGLANVKAISQATAPEMRILKNEAKRLGRETAWSAKEVTDAETLLSQAGFKVNETVAALPGLLDMASAGDIQLAEATDIAAGTLRAFGMEASKSAHVADVLALTASRTNSDITGIGESMKYVAPVSKSLGVSFEETSAAIGMLSDANIKGSQSGTVLRAALARLSNPSKDAAETMERLSFKAFDAQGKMLPLSQVVGNLKRSMSGLSKQQQAQAISTIFGTEAMSGMMALVEQGPEKMEKLTQALKGSDGAARKMAETRLDSLQGQFTILKSAAEGMKIELGERLAPYFKEFVTWLTGKMPDITNTLVGVVEKVSALAKSFNSLSSFSKKTMLGLAVGTLVFNPLAKGITNTAGSIKTLVGLGSKLGSFLGFTKKASSTVKVTKDVAGATTLATKGFSGLGSALKLGKFLLNPWVLGLGATAIVGGKIYKNLKKSSLQVKEFGEEVSKSTATAMNSYMKLDNKLGQSLMSIKIKGTKVTKETASNIVDTFKEMSTQITTAIDQRYSKTYKTMETFMSKASGLRDEQNAEILKKINERQEFEKDIVARGQERINQIWQDAADNHRQITTQEWTEISSIQENMRRTAAENISQSAQEQRIILEKLKTDVGTLTAEQAAQVVQNSNKAKEGATREAEQQYDTVVGEIIHMRDDLGIITSEQASAMIDAAQQQKDETVGKAEAMHTEVVSHAQQQAGEHAAQVNWETGQVRSGFDSMMAKIREFNNLTIKEKVIKITKKIDTIFSKQNNTPLGTYRGPGSIYKMGPGFATGTNNATPGVHEVAEHGFEIVFGRQHRLFNGGEKVLNHKESKEFLKNDNEKTKESKPRYSIAKPQLTMAGAGGTNVNVDVDVENNFNNDTDIDTIVKEAAKQFAFNLKKSLQDIK